MGNYSSKITGVGSYYPSKVVTNHDLEKMMDTSDEWITKRTGIKERRWVEDECNSDLALEASLNALAHAGISKEELDMIIYATIAPDHEFPGTGCFFQAKLGCPEIPVLDIRQQCTGFIYGLSIADMYIKSGQYKNILLVGSEVQSSGLDKTSRGRDVAVLFGDGAGAVVVSRTEVKDKNKDSHIFSTHLHADGRFTKELWMPAPGCALGHEERIDHEMLDKGLHYPVMNGKKVFVHAIKRMSESIPECLEPSGYSIEDVDFFFFHQANLRINESLAQKNGIPEDKVFNTIQRFGNTTAATIPIGMQEAIAADKLKRGMLVVLSAFGSGFTWASALVRF